MDKDVTKRLLRDAGLAIAPFITLTRANRQQFSFTQVKDKLGLPLFVKPANRVFGRRQQSQHRRAVPAGGRAGL